MRPSPEKAVAWIIAWGRMGLTWQEMRARAEVDGWVLYWRRARAVLEPLGLWAPTMRRGPGGVRARRWRCRCPRCGVGLFAYPTQGRDGWVCLFDSLLSHLRHDHRLDERQLKIEESKLKEGTSWDWEQGD